MRAGWTEGSSFPATVTHLRAGSHPRTSGPRPQPLRSHLLPPRPPVPTSPRLWLLLPLRLNSRPAGGARADPSRPRLRPRPDARLAGCLASPWSFARPADAARRPGNREGQRSTQVAAAKAAAMVSNPVHGLPFLPGTSFKDSTVRTPPPGGLAGLAPWCTCLLHPELLSPFRPVLCPQLFSVRHHSSVVLPLQPHPLSPILGSPLLPL